MYVCNLCSVLVNIIFRLVSLANIMNQKAKVKSFFGDQLQNCMFSQKAEKHDGSFI